jgi:hypothetical protein
LPPNVKNEWDANDVWTQALILGYSQIRDAETAEESNNILKALFGGK